MASVGTLTVELQASLAKFQSDLGRAVKSVEGAGARMEGALRGVVTQFAVGLAAGLSIRAFTQFIQRSIEAADHLDDLSQSTGISVEALAGLGFAATQSGSSLHGIARAVALLNVKMSDAASGNVESVATFKALGISVKDAAGNIKSSEQVFAEIADRFASWQDNADKAALGNKLFGRSYQEIIPTLNLGGQGLRDNIEYVKRFGGITAETAKRAGEFNDSISKLGVLTQGAGQRLANSLIPVLDDVAKSFIRAGEEALEAKDAFFGVTREDVKAWAQNAALAIATLAESLIFTGRSARALVGSFQAVAADIDVLLARTNAPSQKLTGAFGFTAEEAAESEKVLQDALSRRDRIQNDADQRYIDLLKKNAAFITDALKQQFAASAGPATFSDARFDALQRGKGKVRAPRQPDTGAQSAAAAAAKKILDGQLKALADSIRDENDLLKVREEFLRGYFNDDLIAFAEYFQTRQDLVRDNLAKQIAAFAEEARLLEAAKPKTKTAAEREELENKIQAVIRNRAKAEHDAALDSIRLFREQDKEAQKFRDTIEQVGIELAQISGNTTAAAISSFEIRYRSELKLATLLRESGNEEEARQGRLLGLQLDGLRQRVVAEAGLHELMTRFGQSIEGLGIAHERINLARESGALNELQALQKISDKNREWIAQLVELEARMAAIVATTGDPAMILALEQIRLQIDQLSQETDLVGDKFRGIFRDSFTDAFTSIVDGSKSAKDAILDFAKSVEQAITRIAAQNLAEALFGGQKGGSGGTGLLGGFIGDISKWIFGGGRAHGGSIWPGRVYEVGERGKEFIMPLAPMRVIPNHEIGGGKSISVVQNFEITGPVDRHSQTQIAAEAYRGLVRAQRVL